MVKKPIKESYKISALCERGYLYDFMFTSRKQEGVLYLVGSTNVVLALITVHTVNEDADSVMRLRKRSSVNATRARRPFGDQSRVLMSPEAIRS